MTFKNIGQFFGGVAGLFGADATQDDAAEAAISKLAELATVRQNYFTVLICSQAIQDVGGLPYDSNGDGIPDRTAAYGVVDTKRDASGKVIGYADRILADQKLCATVYRDAISNRLRVERLEFMNE